MYPPLRPLVLMLAAVATVACAPPKRLDSPRSSYPRSLPPPAPIPLAPARPAPVVSAPRTAPAASGGAVLPVITPVMRAQPAPAAVDTATESRNVELARQEMQQLVQYTGLSDDQLARVRSAEAQIANGLGSAALSSTRALNAELKNAVKPYKVKSGDSLSIISAKPEIYGNPWLWPLIWQANLRVVPDPNVIEKDQVLKIRPNPTVGEVVQAVTTAKDQARRTDTSVGEIREARPE